MKIKRNNKGISELVSYVLLITLAIAMAGGVFIWLKFYASNPLPEEPCDGISISVEYSCADNKITISLTNTGRFSIQSARVRLYDETGSVFLEKDVPEQQGQGSINPIEPGKSRTEGIIYTESIKKIEVIPFLYAFDSNNHAYTKFCAENKIIREINDLSCEYIAS